MKKILKKYWAHLVLLLSLVPIILFISESYISNGIFLWISFVIALGMCIFYAFNFSGRNYFKVAEESMTSGERIFWRFLRFISFVFSHFISIAMAIAIKAEINCNYTYLFILITGVFIIAVFSIFKLVTQYIENNNLVDTI